jgi:hypothetical protein
MLGIILKQEVPGLWISMESGVLLNFSCHSQTVYVTFATAFHEMYCYGTAKPSLFSSMYARAYFAWYVLLLVYCARTAV